MAENPGVYPLDPATPVGQLRALVGDTSSIPLDPPVAGQASYAVWSDVALEAALALADDSVYAAGANLYLALAAQYAPLGRSIKTDDLALDTKGTAGDLISIAKEWRAQNALDAAGGDSFAIVPWGGRAGRRCAQNRVEGSPYPLIGY